MVGRQRPQWCADVTQAATVIDGDDEIAAPKTRRSRRVIDLDPDTAAILQRHRAQQRELLFRLGVTAPVDDRVFTNEIIQSAPTRSARRSAA